MEDEKRSRKRPAFDVCALGVLISLREDNGRVDLSPKNKPILVDEEGDRRPSAMIESLMWPDCRPANNLCPLNSLMQQLRAPMSVMGYHS